MNIIFRIIELIFNSIVMCIHKTIKFIFKKNEGGKNE